MIAESQTAVREVAPTAAETLAVPCHRTPTVLPRRAVVMVPQTWYTGCKRVADVIVALTILLFSSPILLLAALAVKFTSRGPVFYSQTRVGRGGQPFTLYKIRSMFHECERASGAVWSAGKGDPRVMPIGRFLRRTHFDELPQLLNVLRGDMSMIGPRPERPEFVPQLEQAIPHYRERLLVLPGVTGLAQIHLGADTDLGSVERKLAMDLYYIKMLTFWIDAKILIGTFFHVFQPFLASRRLFGVTAQSCADTVGLRILPQPGPLGPGVARFGLLLRLDFVE
jgi:lipopolysaccharide/colanic/teichoic acid biosynthesis glycosyltransferase